MWIVQRMLVVSIIVYDLVGGSIGVCQWTEQLFQIPKTEGIGLGPGSLDQCLDNLLGRVVVIVIILVGCSNGKLGDIPFRIVVCKGFLLHCWSIVAGSALEIFG